MKIVSYKCKYKVAVVFFLIITAVAFAVVLLSSAEQSSGASPIFSYSAAVETTQYKGNSLNVPSGEAVIGNKSYAASHRLIFPSGRESSYSSVKLDELGNYRLVYAVDISGETYTDDIDFVTVFPMSSYWESVKENDMLRDSSIVSNFNFSPEFNGVKVTGFNESSEVKYKNIINLAGKTRFNELISLYITPKEIGLFDFSELIIRLTDIHDSDNFLTIMLARDIWMVPYSSTVRIKAGANLGYALRSYQYQQGHVTTMSGFEIDSSFLGNSPNSIKLYYDDNEKSIYAAPQWKIQSNMPALDLDDPAHVGDGNEWQGFTTGEVYLSIIQKSFSSVDASYMILGVDGKSMQGEYEIDTTPPEITLNMKDNVQTPHGVVGIAYPIFSATAFDEIDGNIERDCEVEVFYIENGERALLIPSGKAFTPPKAGTYHICYSIADDSGNIAKKTVEVVIKAGLPKIHFSFDTQLPSQMNAGEKITIPSWTASGGSGKLTVMREITFNEQPYSASDDIIYPRTEGEFVIQYTIVDYLGQSVIKEFHIDSLAHSELIFIEKNLPKAILVGFVYYLPEMFAFDYSTGIEQPAGVSVTVTGPDGIPQELNKDRALTAAESGEYTVKYFSTDNPATVFLERQIISITPREGDKKYLSDFFLTQNAIINTEPLGMLINAQSAEFSADFINKIPFDGSSLQFRIPALTNGMDGIILTLADSLNKEETLTIKIIKNNDNSSYIQVNGGEQKGLAVSFFGKSSNPVRLNFNKSGSIIDYTGKVVNVIEEFSNGKKFNGFSSGEYYLSISFEYGSGGFSTSGIELQSICNQTFGDATHDYVMPAIFLSDNLALTGEINESIRVPSGVAFDVLNPITSLALTITAPDGGVIAKDVSTQDDYLFVASLYGEYQVTYKATSSNGQSMNLYYLVEILDKIAPTIQIEGNMPKNGSVDKAVKLPSAIVTDNYDVSVELFVFVIAPSGKMTRHTDTLEFTPATKGQYQVVYYARDKNFNTVSISYYIDVN